MSLESRQKKPLLGINVIELHAIGPIPFAGRLLMQLGASVTRISPPADPGLGVGVATKHDVSNEGKAIVRLNLKSTDGQSSLHQLLSSADVLLEGFRPQVLERLGFEPSRLVAKYPRLVIGRLSGWGSNGPLSKMAGHDINYLALTGALNAIGKADQPVPALNMIADYGGGAMHLVAGVLAKLVARGIDGRGGSVETSIAAGTVGLLPLAYGLLADHRWSLERESNLLDGGAPFYRTYRCRDARFIAVGAIESKFYRDLLALCGLDKDLDAERQLDCQTWPEMARRFEECFATRNRDEWEKLAEGRDCCLSPVLDFEEATHHPQAIANGWHLHAPFPRPAPPISFPS